MDSRRAVGSWLSGPRAAAEEMGADFGYRGQRLGLPEEGPGSVAPVGRRLGALLIDGWLCSLIAYGLLARGDVAEANLWTTPVFFVMSAVLLATAGFTPGKRLLGLRLIRLDGGQPAIPQVLLRTLLLILVLPAAVWDRDTRGLHDRAAGLVQVRI